MVHRDLCTRYHIVTPHLHFPGVRLRERLVVLVIETLLFTKDFFTRLSEYVETMRHFLAATDTIAV